MEQVRALLDTLDRRVILSDQDGEVLTSNDQAQEVSGACLGWMVAGPLNILQDLSRGRCRETSAADAGRGGRNCVKGNPLPAKPYQARVRWIRDSDWLAIELGGARKGLPCRTSRAQPTVQELLQEREITYRNLLAAYLKLQEVNRQKTVFLASAAHELKTPLAVIKGYYDLLLTGSLGKLTEKQRDILEESKESCERLVRLVSMFLNYSALESGKLVLQLRENDLRDCLEEIASRWSDGYQRKGVKLESQLDPSHTNV